MKLTETLSAWVTIDGEQVKEYGVEISADGRNATCWIASELGKNFELSVEDHPIHATIYKLKIDGRSERGKVTDAKDQKLICTWRGHAISPNEIRPFVFSPIQSSDDDTLLNNINLLSSQDLGTIVLSGGHCDLGKQTFYTFPDVAAAQSVHERTKKGVDHQITFGIPKTFASNQTNITTTITGGRFSFAFKYRPLELLQTNGIAPCDPSPSTEHPHTPIEEACKFDLQEEQSSSDDEELFRLKTRKRQLELEQIEDELRRHTKRKSKGRSQHKNVKRESFGPNIAGPRTKKVKREDVSSQATHDVIDLTSD